jgi:beta-phosphoglucomutase-like phosphatase (HAD superfamily)
METPEVCVFDLDHTLVASPLDLRAVASELETFIRGRGLPLPMREQRWSGTEMIAWIRREAPHLEGEAFAIPVAHERRAMLEAAPEPFAVECVSEMRRRGLGTAVWTNNDRVAADFVLGRFGLAEHLDLVVTRDDMEHLKPDPDGLRVVRRRWPAATRIVMIGDSWVDAAAAQAGGVPFIGYRCDTADLASRGIAVTATIASLLDLGRILG